MTTRDTGPTTARWTPVQGASLLVGAAFLLVGVLGFIPGVTTHYDTLTWSGHHSGAMLLGVFAVSVLHNIIHLAFGIAGLAMARTFNGARAFLVGGGILYAVVWLYGLLVDHASSANFIPVNNADNWLHLGLALGMIVLGLALGGMRTRSAARSAGNPPGTTPGTAR
jgi:Domain of unknown function (DUF4383)